MSDQAPAAQSPGVMPPESMPDADQAPSPRDLPLTDAPWRVLPALGLVALMVAMTIGAGLAIGFVRRLDLSATLTEILGGAALLAVYGVVMGAVMFGARAHGSSLAASVGLRRMPVGVVISYALGLAVAARVLAGVWATMLQSFHIRIPGSDLDPTRILGRGPVATAILLAIGIVAAPVVEEIVFRGVLLPAIAVRWRVAAGVLVSSVAFAAVHVSPYAMAPIFGLALMLAGSFVSTRSLWVPIAAHATFNAIGFGVLFLIRGIGGA